MSRDGGSITALTGRFPASDPYRLVAVGVALLAGIVVFVLAHDLFPYHSSNHDEGVYLQQAAMLLEGQLYLTPGSDEVRAAVRPWFFVESEAGLYPKYAPIPAAIFAIGMLVGDPRIILAVVASINVGLGYVLASAAFDRRTGVVAAATMAAAPLFLIPSSVFLPYAPTAALNLGFAVAYVRSVRRNDPRYAILAGCAIGLAFFARPFTAVLFATPFVAHALWRLSRAHPPTRATLTPYGLTAGVALLFVGVTLAYNATLTGSPFRFPYEAFAPRDGLGFGRRAILGYELHYTPDLAMRATALVLWTFATGWFTAGLVGVGFALAGLVAAAVTLHRRGFDRTARLSRAHLQIILLGVIVTVVVGNVFFWGNRNILGDLTIPDDGLISLFGPFYHFDVLLPMSAFAANGVVTALDGLRARMRRPALTGRVGVALVLVVASAAVVSAEADAIGPPVERNAAYSAKYERAYEPFESTDLTDALVFLPPAYGEWQHHPFQWLRNSPDLDGPMVFVISRNPSADFAVLDNYPKRTVYRYRYHGEWTPDPRRHVLPRLEPVRRVEGEAIAARTTVTIPDRIVATSVSVSTGKATQRYDLVGAPPEKLSVDWLVTADGVAVSNPNLVSRNEGGSTPLPLDGGEEVVLTVTLIEPEGGTLTYREAVSVRATATHVTVLWPPASSACPLVTDCGPSGTYLPDRPDTRPAGIAMNTTLVEVVS